MEPEEKPRAFGMAVGEVVEPPKKTPAWASPMVWGFLGAALGACVFVWSQRQGIERAARKGLPQAQLAARKLAVAAQGAKAMAGDLAGDLAKDTGLAEEPESELPHGLTGAELSAPTDPTGLRRPVAKRKGGPRRRTASGDMPNSGQVQDVRARWDAPDVSYEAPVPWLETDMAKGVQITGGLALFFWLFGLFLFRMSSRKPRSF